jgi:hypothetical protein
MTILLVARGLSQSTFIPVDKFYYGFMIHRNYPPSRFRELKRVEKGSDLQVGIPTPSIIPPPFVPFPTSSVSPSTTQSPSPAPSQKNNPPTLVVMTSLSFPLISVPASPIPAASVSPTPSHLADRTPSSKITTTECFNSKLEAVKWGRKEMICMTFGWVSIRTRRCVDDGLKDSWEIPDLGGIVVWSDSRVGRV